MQINTEKDIHFGLFEKKCRKCSHKSHCDEECMSCYNDICTGCSCEKCDPDMLALGGGFEPPRP